MAATEPSRPQSPASAPAAGVRARGLVVAAVLVVANVHWLVQADGVRHDGVITKLSLTYNALFTLMLLAAANAALRRISRRAALNAAEMIVIYTAVFLASSLAGLDMLQPLMTTITHPFWFASPENGWEEFFPLLPEALTVRDPAVLRDLYEGGTTLLEPGHLRPWLTPGLLWSGFVCVLFAVMTSLNVLLRRRWMDREKLSFPLVEIPLEMSTNFTGLFANRLLWFGFGIALVIDLLGGLSHYYPSVPHIDIRAYRGVRIFDTRPWSAIGRVELGTPPFVIGLGYFLPLPVLFSCWFFFLFARSQHVFTAVVGLEGDRRMPYLAEQTFGAYVAIAALVVINARRYWRHVLASALGEGSEIDESDEPMSYRAAVVGVVLGFVLLVAFANVFGMTVWYATGFFTVYFVTSLVVTRIRAELGPPAHDLPYASPGEIIIGLGGSTSVSKQDRALSAMFLWFTRGYRTHPMPVQLEGFKMAERIGADQRSILTSTWMAYLLGIVTTFWGMLYSFYRWGEATAMIRGESVPFGNQAYRKLQSWLVVPTTADYRGMAFVAAGVAFTALLNWGKLTYPWWPLYPVGFALQGGWMMRHIWFGLLVVWLAKTVLLRYGGGNIYRRAAPFFMGLALGEFTMASIWSLYGVAFQRSVWSFWS
ncbi:MAG: DUF6785 family protein [Armatimonadota bacterium]|nr:DUF6785 family protein [Armatimonadota bacterium]